MLGPMLGVLSFVLLLTSCYGGSSASRYGEERVADVVVAHPAMPAPLVLPPAPKAAADVVAPSFIREDLAVTVKSEPGVPALEPVSTGPGRQAVSAPVVGVVLPDGDGLGSLSPLAILNRASAVMEESGSFRFRGRMGRRFVVTGQPVEAVRGLVGVVSGPAVGYRLLPLVPPGVEWDLVRTDLDGGLADIKLGGSAVESDGVSSSSGWGFLRGPLLRESDFSSLEVYVADALEGRVYVVPGLMVNPVLGGPVDFFGPARDGGWTVEFVVDSGDFRLVHMSARLVGPEGETGAWVELDFHAHGVEVAVPVLEGVGPAVSP